MNGVRNERGADGVVRSQEWLRIMSSKKSKIRLICGFAALAALALAISCRGFFVNATIASFVISPTNPTVLLGGTTQMHAYGTDSNGNPTGDITDKITWSSKDPSSISVGTSDGLLSGLTLNSSPVEIDANYQALTQQSTDANVCVATNTVVSGSFQIVPANNTNVGSNGTFPNNGGMTASVEAPVDGTTETLDITAAATWSSNNANLTITNGISPATVTMTPVTSNTNVLVTATYTCNGASISQSVTIVLTPGT